MSSEDHTSTHYPSNMADFQPETASSLLGAARFNPADLHPMAGLAKGGGLDYLNLEDTISSSNIDGRRGRGWSDELSYGTGTAYFLGLTSGGAWGLIEGLRSTEAKANMKLRINGILNACTRRGPFVGNSVGVLAMMYCGANSMIRATRGKNDAFNSILAAGSAGAAFKSTAGLRPMGVAGGLGVALAGSWALFRELKEYIPKLIRGEQASL